MCVSRAGGARVVRRAQLFVFATTREARDDVLSVFILTARPGSSVWFYLGCLGMSSGRKG